jgi:hypothetical protein
MKYEHVITGCRAYDVNVATGRDDVMMEAQKPGLGPIFGARRCGLAGRFTSLARRCSLATGRTPFPSHCSLLAGCESNPRFGFRFGFHGLPFSQRRGGSCQTDRTCLRRHDATRINASPPPTGLPQFATIGQTSASSIHLFRERRGLCAWVGGRGVGRAEQRHVPGVLCKLAEDLRGQGG